MNRKPETTWLDKAIASTAPGPAPQPDYAAWQQVHASALETLKRCGRDRQRSKPLWRIIMESKHVRVAAVAVLVIGVLALAQYMRETKSLETPVVKEGSTQGEIPVEDNAQNLQLQRELALARELRDQGDIAGLLKLLDSNLEETRVLAASYLGEIGDESALPSLRKLAALWEGDPKENPYQKAIDAIQTRIQVEGIEPNKAPSDVASPVDEANEAPVSLQQATPAGCRGKVIDRQGKPIAGAKVLLYYDGIYTLDDDVLEVGRTDDAGKFSLRCAPVFKTVTQHSYHRDVCYLIAFHPDYAFGWMKIYADQELSAYEVVLTESKDQVITVVDANEVPLPGVRVWVYSAGDREGTDPLFQMGFGVEKDLGFNGATTDATGQARVTNMPQTRCSVYASRSGYASTLAFPGQRRIRLTPGADLSGHIHVSAGQPLVNAVVTLAADWRFNRYFWTRTDQKGHFRFQDLPANGWDMSAWGKGKTGDGRYILTVEHDLYAVPEQKIQLQPDENETLSLDVYPETTLLHCRVVAIDDNTPLAGVRLGGSNAIGDIGGYTDANGMYSLRVLPGKTSLWFHSPPDGVFVMDRDQNPLESSLRFDAEGSEMSLILKTPPIAGYMIDISGVVRCGEAFPYIIGSVYAAASERFNAATVTNYIQSMKWDEQGIFTLKGVPAGLGLHLYAETKDRSFAGIGVFEIPSDPHGTPPHLDLRLYPTESAQVTVLDKQGDPVPNTRFQIFPMVKEKWLWRADQIRCTNEQGQLSIDGVVPGLTYHVRDARFDSSSQIHTEDRDTWVEKDMILLPLDSDLP